MADVHKVADHLWYSPVAPLELASKYTATSFEHRRAAAQAILDSGAELLPDPESYLTQLFDLPLVEADFDWVQAVHGMAQSATLEELQQGVPDFGARVRRSVNIIAAREYCSGIEQDFVNDMVGLQKSDIPEFAVWWKLAPADRQAKVPRMAEDLKKAFVENTTKPEFVGSVFWACMERAAFKSAEPLPWPPTEAWVHRIVEATDQLEFYCSIYIQYLIRLLTEGMVARENDWFDLELMLYSRDDDHVVVTADKKWRSLALKAGMEQRIVVL